MTDNTLNSELKKLATARRKVNELEAKYKAANAEYEELRIELLGRMNAEGIESLRGAGLSCTTSKRARATVKDWDKLYAYISRTKAYDLLQRRVSVTAVVDRIDNGKKPPVLVESVKILTVKEVK